MDQNSCASGCDQCRIRKRAATLQGRFVHRVHPVVEEPSDDTIGERERVDVILTNPPFGGEEDITHLPPDQLAEAILKKEQRNAEIMGNIQKLLAKHGG